MAPGPAYIFYLIEAMLESSKNLKLPEEEKVNLISAMIAGSANLAKNSTIFANYSPYDTSQSQ